MSGIYIKREDARTLLFDRLIETANNNTGYQCDSGVVYQDAAERLRLCWLNEVPAADVVEQKHGKWERKLVPVCDDGIIIIPGNVCSECGGITTYNVSLFKYCPRCGAEMESEGE